MNLKKSVVVLTLICFLISGVLNQAVYATVEMRRDTGQFKQIIDDFAIPSSLGRVTKARFYGSGKVVVNIQDLHCHPEVQRNISRLIGLLDKKYQLKNVFVEGASGNVSTAWLSDIADAKYRSGIVETLVEQGKLTGSEYYSVTQKRPDLLRGMEDEGPYEQNIVRLGKILEKKEYFARKTAALGEDLAVMQLRYFNRQNKAFDRLVNEHRQGKIATEKYYRILKKYVEMINEHPEKYDNVFVIDKSSYANLQAYVELVDAGKKLEYRRIARQLQQFVGILKQKLPYSAYNYLLEKTDNFTKLDELYVYLARISREYRLDVSGSFPDLARFFAYVEKGQAVNPLLLVKEERKLAEQIRLGLSQDRTELEISFLSDFFVYFSDYLNNRLTAEDYAYFVSQFDQFKTLWEKYAFRNRLTELEGDFALLDEFYRVNVARNDYFMKNMLGDYRNAVPVTPAQGLGDNILKTAESLGRADEIVVVVAGGFHTEGLEKLLDERRISYLDITPNVTRDTKRSDAVYMEIAKQQAKILSQAIALKMLSTMDPDDQDYVVASALVAAHLQGVSLLDETNKNQLLKELERQGLEFKSFTGGKLVVYDKSANRTMTIDMKAAVSPELIGALNDGRVRLWNSAEKATTDAILAAVASWEAGEAAFNPETAYKVLRTIGLSETAINFLMASNLSKGGLIYRAYHLQKDTVDGADKGAAGMALPALQNMMVTHDVKKDAVNRAAEKSNLLAALYAVNYIYDLAIALEKVNDTSLSGEETRNGAEETDQDEAPNTLVVSAISAFEATGYYEYEKLSGIANKTFNRGLRKKIVAGNVVRYTNIASAGDDPWLQAYRLSLEEGETGRAGEEELDVMDEAGKKISGLYSQLWDLSQDGKIPAELKNYLKKYQKQTGMTEEEMKSLYAELALTDIFLLKGADYLDVARNGEAVLAHAGRGENVVYPEQPRRIWLGQKAVEKLDKADLLILMFEESLHFRYPRGRHDKEIKHDKMLVQTIAWKLEGRGMGLTAAEALTALAAGLTERVMGGMKYPVTGESNPRRASREFEKLPNRLTPEEIDTVIKTRQRRLNGEEFDRIVFIVSSEVNDRSFKLEEQKQRLLDYLGEQQEKFGNILVVINSLDEGGNAVAFDAANDLGLKTLAIENVQTLRANRDKIRKADMYYFRSGEKKEALKIFSRNKTAKTGGAAKQKKPQPLGNIAEIGIALADEVIVLKGNKALSGALSGQLASTGDKVTDFGPVQERMDEEQGSGKTLTLPNVRTFLRKILGDDVSDETIETVYAPPIEVLPSLFPRRFYRKHADKSMELKDVLTVKGIVSDPRAIGSIALAASFWATFITALYVNPVVLSAFGYAYLANWITHMLFNTTMVLSGREERLTLGRKKTPVIVDPLTEAVSIAEKKLSVAGNGGIVRRLEKEGYTDKQIRGYLLQYLTVSPEGLIILNQSATIKLNWSNKHSSVQTVQQPVVPALPRKEQESQSTYRKLPFSANREASLFVTRHPFSYPGPEEIENNGDREDYLFALIRKYTEDRYDDDQIKAMIQYISTNLRLHPQKKAVLLLSVTSSGKREDITTVLKEPDRTTIAGVGMPEESALETKEFNAWKVAAWLLQKVNGSVTVTPGSLGNERDALYKVLRAHAGKKYTDTQIKEITSLFDTKLIAHGKNPVVTLSLKKSETVPAMDEMEKMPGRKMKTKPRTQSYPTEKQFDERYSTTGERFLLYEIADEFFVYMKYLDGRSVSTLQKNDDARIHLLAFLDVFIDEYLKRSNDTELQSFKEILVNRLVEKEIVTVEYSFSSKENKWYYYLNVKISDDVTKRLPLFSTAYVNWRRLTTPDSRRIIEKLKKIPFVPERVWEVLVVDIGEAWPLMKDPGEFVNRHYTDEAILEGAARDITEAWRPSLGYRVAEERVPGDTAFENLPESVKTELRRIGEHAAEGVLLLFKQRKRLTAEAMENAVNEVKESMQKGEFALNSGEDIREPVLAKDMVLHLMNGVKEDWNERHPTVEGNENAPDQMLFLNVVENMVQEYKLLEMGEALRLEGAGSIYFATMEAFAVTVAGLGILSVLVLPMAFTGFLPLTTVFYWLAPALAAHPAVSLFAAHLTPVLSALVINAAKHDEFNRKNPATLLTLGSGTGLFNTTGDKLRARVFAKDVNVVEVDRIPETDVKKAQLVLTAIDTSFGTEHYTIEEKKGMLKHLSVEHKNNNKKVVEIVYKENGGFSEDVIATAVSGEARSETETAFNAQEQAKTFVNLQRVLYTKKKILDVLRKYLRQYSDNYGLDYTNDEIEKIISYIDTEPTYSKGKKGLRLTVNSDGERKDKIRERKKEENKRAEVEVPFEEKQPEKIDIDERAFAFAEGFFNHIKNKKGGVERDTVHTIALNKSNLARLWKDLIDFLFSDEGRAIVPDDGHDIEVISRILKEGEEILKVDYSHHYWKGGYNLVFMAGNGIEPVWTRYLADGKKSSGKRTLNLPETRKRVEALHNSVVRKLGLRNHPVLERWVRESPLWEIYVGLVEAWPMMKDPEKFLGGHDAHGPAMNMLPERLADWLPTVEGLKKSEGKMSADREFFISFGREFVRVFARLESEAEVEAFGKVLNGVYAGGRHLDGSFLADGEEGTAEARKDLLQLASDVHVEWVNMLKKYQGIDQVKPGLDRDFVELDTNDQKAALTLLKLMVEDYVVAVQKIKEERAEGVKVLRRLTIANFIIAFALTLRNFIIVDTGASLLAETPDRYLLPMRVVVAFVVLVGTGTLAAIEAGLANTMMHAVYNWTHREAPLVLTVEEGPGSEAEERFDALSAAAEFARWQAVQHAKSEQLQDIKTFIREQVGIFFKDKGYNPKQIEAIARYLTLERLITTGFDAEVRIVLTKTAKFNMKTRTGSAAVAKQSSPEQREAKVSEEEGTGEPDLVQRQKVSVPEAKKKVRGAVKAKREQMKRPGKEKATVKYTPSKTGTAKTKNRKKQSPKKNRKPYWVRAQELKTGTLSGNDLIGLIMKELKVGYDEAVMIRAYLEIGPLNRILFKEDEVTREMAAAEWERQKAEVKEMLNSLPREDADGDALLYRIAFGFYEQVITGKHDSGTVYYDRLQTKEKPESRLEADLEEYVRQNMQGMTVADPPKTVVTVIEKGIITVRSSIYLGKQYYDLVVRKYDAPGTMTSPVTTRYLIPPADIPSARQLTLRSSVERIAELKRKYPRATGFVPQIGWDVYVSVIEMFPLMLNPRKFVADHYDEFKFYVPYETAELLWQNDEQKMGNDITTVLIRYNGLLMAEGIDEAFEEALQLDKKLDRSFVNNGPVATKDARDAVFKLASGLHDLWFRTARAGNAVPSQLNRTFETLDVADQKMFVSIMQSAVVEYGAAVSPEALLTRTIRVKRIYYATVLFWIVPLSIWSRLFDLLTGSSSYSALQSFESSVPYLAAYAAKVAGSVFLASTVHVIMHVIFKQLYPESPAGKRKARKNGITVDPFGELRALIIMLVSRVWNREDGGRVQIVYVADKENNASASGMAGATRGKLNGFNGEKYESLVVTLLEKGENPRADSREIFKLTMDLPDGKGKVPFLVWENYDTSGVKTWYVELEDETVERSADSASASAEAIVRAMDSSRDRTSVGIGLVIDHNPSFAGQGAALWKGNKKVVSRAEIDEIVAAGTDQARVIGNMREAKRAERDALARVTVLDVGRLKADKGAKPGDIAARIADSLKLENGTILVDGGMFVDKSGKFTKDKLEKLEEIVKLARGPEKRINIQFRYLVDAARSDKDIREAVVSLLSIGMDNVYLDFTGDSFTPESIAGKLAMIPASAPVTVHLLPQVDSLVVNKADMAKGRNIKFVKEVRLGRTTSGDLAGVRDYETVEVFFDGTGSDGQYRVTDADLKLLDAIPQSTAIIFHLDELKDFIGQERNNIAGYTLMNILRGVSVAIESNPGEYERTVAGKIERAYLSQVKSEELVKALKDGLTADKLRTLLNSIDPASVAAIHLRKLVNGYTGEDEQLLAAAKPYVETLAARTLAKEYFDGQNMELGLADERFELVLGQLVLNNKLFDSQPIDGNDLEEVKKVDAVMKRMKDTTLTFQQLMTGINELRDYVTDIEQAPSEKGSRTAGRAAAVNGLLELLPLLDPRLPKEMIPDESRRTLNPRTAAAILKAA